MRRHWPVLGILLSVSLFVAAAFFYPGGTTDSTTTVGYDWTRNFISSLFAPTALNGSANPARYLAIPAMLALCISVGFVFKRIAASVTSKPRRKTIEIAGIGSMLYAFLAVTPMHDVMVDMSLVFFLAATVALLSELYLGRARGLFIAGVSCLSLVLVSAIVYYGHVYYQLLPVLQKSTFVACTVWIFAVYYSALGRDGAGRRAAGKAMKPTG